MIFIVQFKPDRRKQQRRKSTGRRIADVPGRRINRRRADDKQGYRKPK